MSDQQYRRTIALLVGALLVIDQVVKIVVKTHMQLGQEYSVCGDWFRIHFIENEGFAFGMAIGGNVGKIVLTVLRLVASVVIGWLVVRWIKQGSRRSLTTCMALIFAGAVGNLIDSCFYGLIFNESYYTVATLFPPEGGYAPLLMGRVVDMFYFPLFAFDWPQWLPLLGGKHFEFFNAIFNVADASITIGIIWLVIDQIFIAPTHTKPAMSNEDTHAE